MHRSARTGSAAVSGILLLSLIVVACGGAPASTPGTPTGAATATPEGTSGPTGNECVGVPTLNLGNAEEPQFTGDPELEALFPAQIGGEPVTDIRSYRMVEFFCYIGGQALVDQMRANLDTPLDLATMSVANGEVTLDGATVELSAIRLPGQGASNVLTDLVQLVQTFAGGSMGDIGGSVTNADVGGKSVQVFSSADGEVAYIYVIGDSMIVISDVSEAQAATILGALP
jgi:hypothetical protein